MATILIVDDEAPIVELLVDIISEEGHTVLQAQNGMEGLTLARANQPDLVISDVMMPILDGYALLRELRSSPETAHTQIILMSAAFSQGARLDSNGIVADGYLRKPFDLAAIERLLDGLN